MTAERPATLAAGRDWPPRRVTAQRAPVDGAIEVAGQLVNDAELRLGAGGGRAVIVFTLETGKGYPYEVVHPIPAAAADLQAASTLQRTLRRGTSVRVRAHGCIPRIDHGNAVLQLLEVTTVIPT